MTSRNGNIQLLYNKIKELEPWDWSKCDCSNDTCENCSSMINSLQQQYKLFRKHEIDKFIKIILGIHEGNTFVCNYLKFDSPFSKITDTSEIVWSSVDYHIVFIDCGIRLIMNEKMISRIGILDSILNKEHGYDKPLRLNYLCCSIPSIMEGPLLYITKLPLDSLIFTTPPADYNNRLFRGGYDGSVPPSYYKYNNVAEAIFNKIYY
tara:strand:- start:2286 stop:2906 length:621 start_codon:yes stop_codon:yes gene_type:complete